MKTVSKLSLIALAVLMTACNEKVSPELQQGNATTPDTVAIPPSEYYFSVTNSSDVMLGYKLHKTGIGNGNTPCEIKNTTGFSSDIFRGDPTANDITCYFEAEELSLYMNGLSFDINASKNTCDFVSYSPYGFYDYIPGDSTAVYNQVKCGSPETTRPNIATAGVDTGFEVSSSTGTIGCNQMIAIDPRLPADTRQPFTVQKDEDLCSFDYSAKEGPNCDVGEITINELTVTFTPATADAPESLTTESASRIVTCGGKVANCVKGPVRKMGENSPMYTEYNKVPLNTPAKVTYEYPNLVDDEKYSLRTYVNYRRNLASKDIQYGSQANIGTYTSAWNSDSIGKIYEPIVADYFSNNKRMNLTDLVTTAMIDAETIRDSKRIRSPLAADPFMGLPSARTSNRVNPFYTFYCHDKAKDIKARIRMVVRDWDRILPTSSSEMEFLSDLFRGNEARQDIPLTPELPGDFDPEIPFNDFADWDDSIPMVRSPGVFNVNTTTWSPVIVAPYDSGWFNRDYFTEGYE